ncbi:tRNA-specific adenosine deaminase 1-like [Scylla paramamosain]|uniref:tRNA-specific adenosine deaminase 1-like n=1 Tax=Scylla paramamosain TaxID=85552 RepID=UPI003082C3C7
MEKYTEKFANKIVQLCISKYNSLKKTGKPKNEAEWTLLSCFVQEEQCSHTLKVVALGTGSKCIGSHQLPSAGDVLHDSHAEVVARRAFMLYLISEVRMAAEGHSSIFEVKDGTYYLKSGILFHFYTSHTPCGDASIFLKQEWLECVGNVLETKEEPTISPSVPIGNSDTEPPVKKRRCQGSSDFEDQITLQNTENAHVKSDDIKKMDDLEKEKTNLAVCTGDVNEVLSDTFRTGAKCVAGEAPDPKLPGSKYHITGVLRTKPGRGDPTLSLSCSDKIFKWTILGVQGALLMILLKKPVYIATIVIGRCPYSQEAMKRAIYGRFEDGLNNLNLPEGFSVQTPALVQSNIDFAHSRINIAKTASEGSKLIPTPTSIIWSDTSVHRESQEVATNGRRLGCTKKNIGTSKSWVSICRKAISCLMLDLLKDARWEPADFNQLTYSDLKYYSESYNQAWNILKSKCLSNWTVKPKHIKDFKVK